MAQNWRARRIRWGHRLAAWRAGHAPVPERFSAAPEPFFIGHYGVGQRLARGDWALGDARVSAADPWAIDPPSERFARDLHGFGWLDHLAAVGDGRAGTAARDHVAGWIAQFGRGAGPGWEPDLTGRRVTRWITHASLLLPRKDQAAEVRLRAALGRQARFLGRRWHLSPPGLPRIEALTGLITAALWLDGLEVLLPPAALGLARATLDTVDAEGAIASRNPEELLEVFTHLVWAASTMLAAERDPPDAVIDTLERIAPVLRYLRHADGGLARFHGGGAGLPGQLERALTLYGQPPLIHGGPEAAGRAMGYARAQGARTSLIVDAAPPPKGADGGRANASTLAFELTSHRRPLIVSCGAAAVFGMAWERAGRQTQAHSTLSVEGVSSARFDLNAANQTERLVAGPQGVTLQRSRDADGTTLLLSHDGWLPAFGLTHSRGLALSADGRMLLGEDRLAALAPADRRRFNAALGGGRGRGVNFALRFHLHPDVEASADRPEHAITLRLRSGEVWLFHFEGQGRLALEPSDYLDPTCPEPRPAQQIVIHATIDGFAGQINWTLAMARDTPRAIRDIGRDDDLALPPDVLAPVGARD
ncbi:heparinase II/III family protein [Pararhodobacter sp. SW119]|uniref:heparinase II/III family protein n=1 Tax=Pararhodobacter sp. SW119 TaxID=2780075 RepID=UPI001ADF08E7|nr:heparinase II/III family protein [Pararhodobacter sp. SW119]